MSIDGFTETHTGVFAQDSCNCTSQSVDNDNRQNTAASNNPKGCIALKQWPDVSFASGCSLDYLFESSQNLLG